MQLFVTPSPLQSNLSGQELSCLVKGGVWHCSTIELKILFAVAILLMGAVAVVVIKSKK